MILCVGEFRFWMCRKCWVYNIDSVGFGGGGVFRVGIFSPHSAEAEPWRFCRTERVKWILLDAYTSSNQFYENTIVESPRI